MLLVKIYEYKIQISEKPERTSERINKIEDERHIARVIRVMKDGLYN